ncbi:protein FAM185A [Condylostylus longicornis]|uniref:protein FAM185A n=1 Tax=Condylostylus longicornis TaxID=2530218 RepID=UPI00244E2EF6|nr:protein FAM185A [Condylostylus longicornis]
MTLLNRFSLKFLNKQKYFLHSIHKNFSNLTKIVDPDSSVSIKTDCNISIKPYDLLDCPDSNIIRATLIHNTNKEGKIADIKEKIGISVQDKNVRIEDIGDTKAKRDDFTCLLEIPIKADLNIESKSDIKIKDMYSDCLKAITHFGSIITKNLRSTSIDLSAINGNIACKGLTLAQKIDVHVKEKGNIFLDKLQGDLLYCKAFNGNIEVNSSYVEKSNFSCEKGNLFLKNIHKTSEIFVLNYGNIEMSGIHGNVYINSKGGDLNLQFSEITGDNIIVANKAKNVTINISDIVETNSYIELHSNKIELDPSANHLSKYLTKENYFEYGDKNKQNKLMICSGGLLKFGKMSWADTVKSQMGLI